VTRIRVAVFSLVLALPFGILEARLLYMQVVNAEEYKSRADWTRSWVEVVPTPRGWIRDRGGEVLAAEERCFDVDLVLADFEKPRVKGKDPELDFAKLAEMLAGLARLAEDETGLDADAMAAMLRKRACPKKTVISASGESEVEPDGERMAAMLRSPDAVTVKPATVALYLKALRVLNQAEDAAERRFVNPEKPVGVRERRNIIRQEWRVPYRLWSGLTYDEMAEIALDEAAYPGLEIRARTRRTYPAGRAACHVVGYVGLMSQAEYDRMEREGYFLREMERHGVTAEEYQRLVFRGSFFGDRVGREGVERVANGMLAGQRGVERREKHLLQKREWVTERLEPDPGMDVELTIDLGLQRIAEELLAELRGLNGSIVVLDARTGEVLAMASNPGFDVNLLKPPISAATWAALRDDPAKPLLNRCIAGAYPLGSIFKVVTGAAALEAGKVGVADLLPCHGLYDAGRWPNKFACWIHHKGGHHGDVDLREAMARSCNCFFFACGERVGIDGVAAMAHRFGIGDRSGIELPGESAGLMPTPAWRRAEGRGRWGTMNTLNISIGQGEILVSPVQAARLMAAVATGKLPRVRVLRATPADSEETGLSPESLRALRAGLEAVCLETFGTGHNAGLHVYKAAGKTSTAQSSSREKGLEHHGWFAGYAPADNPRYAFAVMLEHGGAGSGVPAQVSAKLLAALFPELAPAPAVPGVPFGEGTETTPEEER
jgi:penicillin-binding protein 2